MNPETVYDQLESGNPAALVQLGEEAGDRSRTVDRIARDIVAAACSPRWRAQARQSFEARALEAYLAAAMTSLRLIRASEVLDHLGERLTTAQEDARELIGRWRALPDDLGAFLRQLLEIQYTTALTAIKADYEEQLAKAVSEYLRVDQEFRDWARQGAILDFVFYMEYDVLPAVRVPDSFINGTGGGWVPQGLANDGEGNYLTTSYAPDGDQKDGQSQITVIDGTTGEPGEPVPLRIGPDPDGNRPFPGASPDHAGGVVVHDGRVYVVGGKTLHVYDLADVREASRTGEPATAIRSSPIPASAYVTVDDRGQLYVGEDDTQELYPIDVDSDGVPSWNSDDVIGTPPSANGAVIQGGEFTFTQQTGRDEPARVVTTTPFADGEGGTYSDQDVIRSDELANMAQNLTLLPDGRVVGLSESGALPYSTPKGDGSPLDLWGTTHLFEVPNVGGGIEVEPTTLRQASKDLRAAEAALDAELPGIRSMNLTAGAVGRVSGASAFASEINSYFDYTATRVEYSIDAIGISADGLNEVADTFDETDGESRDRFRSAMEGLL